MKILLVLNPMAGGVSHDATIAALTQLAKRKGVHAEFYFTTGKEDEKNIAGQIGKFRPDRVVSAGGDGTIQLVAKAILPFDLVMGILPTGSANGLAKALALPKDPLEAFERILESRKIKHMDILKFNDEHLCIHVADVGANALIVKKYVEGGERGLLGYAKYLFSAVQETALFHTTIHTPEGTFRKEGFMMAFANAHKYGTGVQISEGSVSDGKFEICNVEKVTLDEAIKAGLTILNVFVEPNMFSDVISCREAEVSIDQKTHFQIDGEYMGMTDHLKIEVMAGALKLLV